MSDIICVQTYEGEALNREEREESSLMLQAMQQQFERMNMVFNDIRDWIDRQVLTSHFATCI